MFVLDIGCGDAPVGDVNCDLYIDDFDGQRSDSKSGYERFHINSKLVPNFVLCCAEYLPFKNGCFDLVNSRQVFEHLKFPLKSAREMVRCSRDLVIIETVHRRGERLVGKVRYRELNKVHINKFDFKYFGLLAKALNVNYVWSETLIFNYYIHFFDLQFFKVPFIIRIVFSKACVDWSYFVNRSCCKEKYLGKVGF